MSDAMRSALEERFGIGPGRAEDEGFSDVVIDEIMVCLVPVVRSQMLVVTDKLQWTLDNIYTIARRHALGKHDPQGRWGHVVRLCEAVGCQPRGVLKDNGGSMAGPSDE